MKTERFAADLAKVLAKFPPAIVAAMFAPRSRPRERRTPKHRKPAR